MLIFIILFLSSTKQYYNNYINYILRIYEIIIKGQILFAYENIK